MGMSLLLPLQCLGYHEAELSLVGLILMVIVKRSVAWCTLLRFVRLDHRVTMLSSDLSTSLRNAERSGSAWRSRKENEAVLGLVLKTELEQKFIFSSLKGPLGPRNQRKRASLVWVSILKFHRKWRILCNACHPPSPRCLVYTFR